MPKRTDTNQAEIIKALRKMGASVVDIHEVGNGCPDIAVGFRGRDYLVEIKNEQRYTLTKDQIKFHKSWNGSITILHSIEHAVQWINRLNGR